MKSKLHAAAGALALVIIGVFWISTAITELFGDAAAIASVKRAVLYGMMLLIPAMAMAGASGLSLAKGWKSAVVARKRLRMQIVAANGLLVLLPSAYVLAGWAQAGRFDLAFGLLQTLELAAGAVNITLLSLNMRDGMKLRRPTRARVAQPAR